MPDLRSHLPAIIATSLFWLALFVAYALFVMRQPAPAPIEIIPPQAQAAEANCSELPAASEPAPTSTPAPLRVYVSGAVREAGVYRLPPDSLVADAIDAAGGASADADLVAINLAHPLSDGEQIYVPTQEETAGPPPPIRAKNTAQTGVASQDASAQPIDLNTATQEELESLPGIGPAMAQRIIEGRPYSHVEDLLRVKGIGEAKLEKMRPYVTVR
ncbi:MAG TPA: ComEA family DNA-binding protein [Caldilineales bacterium]|nr:ComEA family DNA-binding protein [Caldilineales bacterium]